MKNVFIQRNYTLLALMALIFLPLSHAVALDCPDVEYNKKLYESDKTCLVALQKQFKTFSTNDSLEQMSFDLILKYEPVNQEFIADHIYFEYCKYLVSQSGDNLNPSRQEQLLDAKKKLFLPNDSMKIAFDTRNIVNSAPNFLPFQDSDISFSKGNANSFMLVSMDLIEPNQNQTENTYNDEGSIESIEALDLLRDPPYVITKHNRHFVMVGSASDLTAAKRAATDLKLQYPQLNFIVYDRYSGNNYYSIMMATWVPYSVAKKAAKFAQVNIRSDSRVWSCRGRDGKTC